MLWYTIMREFHCNAHSSWSSCDERRERAFTHKIRKHGRTSQLDYILGPKTDSCTTRSSCAVRGTIIQCTLRYWKMMDKTILFTTRRREEARIDFKKAVMDQDGDTQNEDLETVQRGIVEAAKRSVTQHNQTDEKK